MASQSRCKSGKRVEFIQCDHRGTEHGIGLSFINSATIIPAGSSLTVIGRLQVCSWLFLVSVPSACCLQRGAIAATLAESDGKDSNIGRAYTTGYILTWVAKPSAMPATAISAYCIMDNLLADRPRSKHHSELNTIAPTIESEFPLVLMLMTIGFIRYTAVDHMARWLGTLHPRSKEYSSMPTTRSPHANTYLPKDGCSHMFGKHIQALRLQAQSNAQPHHWAWIELGTHWQAMASVGEERKSNWLTSLGCIYTSHGRTQNLHGQDRLLHR